MACECSVADIARECAANAAGMKPLVYVTCEDEVASIAAATDQSVATINMRSAAAGPPAVTKGYLRRWYPNAKGFEFKSEQDAESGTWKTESKFFIPRTTSAKSTILTGLGEDNNILVVTDKNGAKRILGELGSPANVVTSEVAQPKNGYNVTVTWESAVSPFYFTGTPDVTP